MGMRCIPPAVSTGKEVYYMKKLTALLLAVLMFLSLITACEKKPADTSDDPSGTSDVLSSAVSSSTLSQTPSADEYVAPSAYSLKNTKHLPIVDDQGTIGSCTSEGITYAQFTVAVSQYINYHYPDTEWNPSSGDPKYIFSPKFSYNYTAGSTNMCYRILVDDGCLPMSISCFEKYASPSAGFWGSSILNSEKTRSWDVSEGMMLDALNYRLTNYVEQGTPGSITEGNDPFIDQIKEAISKGNVVTVCGGAYNWRQTSLGEQPTDCLAKKGERVIWRADTTPSSGASGHCVALVGYDDNITLEIGGSVMKGAFLMMNSWGQWCNDGFVWVMYDACNSSSEYLAVKSPALSNSGTMALDISAPAFFKGLSNMDRDYIAFFTPVGKTTIEGKEYATYYISNEEKTEYLCYKGGKLSTVQKPNDFCIFAFPEYSSLNGSVATEYKHADVVAVVAVNAPEKEKYLYTPEASGQKPTLTAELTATSNTAFGIYSTVSAEDGSFIGVLYTADNFGGILHTRETAFNSYGFVYWDKDVTVGMPQLSVEVQAETLNRKTLYMILNRIDANGNKEEYIPAMMQIRLNEGALPDTGGGQDKVSFSGKINPIKREEGCFSFGYLPLTDLPEGVDLKDYLWGVSVRGTGVIVKRIRLYDQKKNLIAEVIPDHTVSPLAMGEMVHYSFQLQNTVYSGLGNGPFKLQNASNGTSLALASNGMVFEWEKKSSVSEKSVIRFAYNSKSNGFEIFRYDGNYLLDINGKEIKEGALVKFNKENSTRNTQLWEISQNENTGTVRIALKADPTYVFACVNGQFCITKNAPNDGYVWKYSAGAPTEMPLTISETGGKPILHIVNDNDMELHISSNGALVKTIDCRKTDSFDLSTLSKGSYCFSVYKDGKPCGIQLCYTVQ